MTIKTNKTWNSAEGTVKKSTETSCFAWFFRNVRHVCEGGFGCRTRYLLIEDSEIWIPASRVRYGFSALTSPHSLGLKSESVHVFASAHMVGPAVHVEPSRSNTNESPDGAG